MATAASSEEDYVFPPSGLEIISSLLTIPPTDHTITLLASAFEAHDLETFTSLATSLLAPYEETCKNMRHFVHRPSLQDEDLFCLRNCLAKGDAKTFTLLLLPAYALIIHLPPSTQVFHSKRWHTFLTLPNEIEGDTLLLADLATLRARYALPRLQKLEAEIEEKRKLFAEMAQAIIGFMREQNWDCFAFLPQSGFRAWFLGLVIRIWFVNFAARAFVMLGGEDAFAMFGLGLGENLALFAVVLGAWMYGIGMIGGQLLRGLRIGILRSDGVVPGWVSIYGSISRKMAYGLLALLPLLCLRVSKPQRRLGRSKDGERARRAIAGVEIYSVLLDWVFDTVKTKVVRFWFPRKITNSPAKTATATSSTNTATPTTPATATTTTNTATPATVKSKQRKNFSFGPQHVTFPFGMTLFWALVHMQDVVGTLGSSTVPLQPGTLEAAQKRLLQMTIIFIAARFGRQIFYVRGCDWIEVMELKNRSFGREEWIVR